MANRLQEALALLGYEKAKQLHRSNLVRAIHLFAGLQGDSDLELACEEEVSRILASIAAAQHPTGKETMPSVEVISVSGMSELDRYRDFDVDHDFFIKPQAMQVLRVPRGTTLTGLAGENRFSFFQRLSGVDLSWVEEGHYGKQVSCPVTRAEASTVIGAMTKWMTTESAATEAAKVGTDLDYVRETIDLFQEFVAPDGKWANCHFLVIEKFHNDDRELQKMCDWADEYSDSYWGECANH